ncbi:hypothetical protein Avbf_05969 [Armadillidium vulgare]|nr:hypothetical protein Avbf_05969 [Armadillidium vulgare]
MIMKIKDICLLNSGGKVSKEIRVQRSADGDDIFINFISETWAGIDVQSVYTPRYTPTPPPLEQFQTTKTGKDNSLLKNNGMSKSGKENSLIKAPKRKNVLSQQSKMSLKKSCNRQKNTQNNVEKTPSKTLFQYQFVKVKPKMTLYPRDEVDNSIIEDGKENYREFEYNHSATETRDEVIDFEPPDNIVNDPGTYFGLDSSTRENKPSIKNFPFSPKESYMNPVAETQENQCEETSHQTKNLLAESLRRGNKRGKASLCKEIVNQQQINVHNNTGNNRSCLLSQTPNRTLNHWFPHRKPVAGIRPMLRKQTTQLPDISTNFQSQNFVHETRENPPNQVHQSLLTLYHIASDRRNSSQLANKIINQNGPSISSIRCNAKNKFFYNSSFNSHDMTHRNIEVEVPQNIATGDWQNIRNFRYFQQNNSQPIQTPYSKCSQTQDNILKNNFILINTDDPHTKKSQEEDLMENRYEIDKMLN